MNLKEIIGFLNRDIKSFFKKDYIYVYAGQEEDTVEKRRFDQKTLEEVPYDSLPTQIGPKEILLPEDAWLNYPYDM